MDEKGILVVDPDQHFHMALQEAFAEKPARFIFDKDATETIVLLAVEAPDFAIVSLDFPDNAGVAAMKNIRDFNPDIPIVVTAAKVSKEVLIEARRVNAVDFLLKPVDMERLLRKVSGRLWVTPEMLAAMQGGVDGQATPAEGETPPPPPPEPEPVFVEAIPKGAEMASINLVIPGMKIARTVEQSGVVYIDKGVILKPEHIRLLNKLGIGEVCVYTDLTLKKRAEELRKQVLSQTRVAPTAVTLGAGKKPAAAGGPPQGQVFSKVKRSDIRVVVKVPGKGSFENKEGTPVEINGIVDDVSGGGCAFLSAEELKKDQEMRLEFKLADFPVDVKAVVRHCARKGPTDLPFRTGFLFTTATEKYREKIINKLFDIQRQQKQEAMELRDRFKKRR